MAESASRQLGAHTIHYAEADLLFITLRGDLSESEMLALIQEGYQVMARCDKAFTLLDVTEMNPMSQAVRKTTHREMASRPPFRGTTAIFGASTPVRMLLTLLMNALRLMTGRANEEMSFFKDRDEALAWLLERRRVLTGAKATTT